MDAHSEIQACFCIVLSESSGSPHCPQHQVIQCVSQAALFMMLTHIWKVQEEFLNVKECFKIN